MGANFIQNGLYTTAQAISELERVRGRRIPKETFYYWKRQMGISPSGPGGLYTNDDLRAFASVIENLSYGVTMPQQVEILLEEQNNATRSESSQGQQTTIDINTETP